MSLEARFFEKTKKAGADECWDWTGAITKSTGYGVIWFCGRNIGAHKASWIIHFGDVPAGAYIMHRCDVRSCVNPSHLVLGDHAVNMRDMATKKRAAVGERHGQHRLTEDQVLDILMRHTIGESQGMIARRFDVSRRAIGKIINGKTWSWLTRKDA